MYMGHFGSIVIKMNRYMY